MDYIELSPGLVFLLVLLFISPVLIFVGLFFAGYIYTPPKPNKTNPPIGNITLPEEKPSETEITK